MNTLFSLLENVDIDYINTMGHANYANMVDLTHLRDELIDEVEAKYDHPIIGLGHSSGAATTLLAAAKRPELFEKIILLDPVVFSGRKTIGYLVVKEIGVYGNPLVPAKKDDGSPSRFFKSQMKPLIILSKNLCLKIFIQVFLKVIYNTD